MYRRAWTTLAALLGLAGCGVGGGHVASAVADAACEAGPTGASVVVGSGLPGDPAAPEPASGYRLGKVEVHAASYMVVAANPLAARAGCDILRAGGTAVDAAVAVQMVLGLVEPQSSGLGGGAFMLYYDAAQNQVSAYDGRETAPAAASTDYLRRQSEADPTPPQPDARASGRSIGTPGVVRMLDAAHRDYGRLAWRYLFQPGIDLARNGFPISGRMADALAGGAAGLVQDAEAAALFLHADGTAKALGSVFVNEPYAQTLDTLARDGADAFYTGAIARRMVDKIRIDRAVDGSLITPGLTTLRDVAGYEARRREPLCTTYREYWVCGMPPPSAGGIAVASTLGILESFPLARYAPARPDGEGGRPDVMGAHLISEAERLAYADRDRYVADTDFVPLPGGGWHALLDKDYLARRARLIDARRSMGVAEPGDFGMAPGGRDTTPEGGTTHFSIVDRWGNALAMTSSVEAGLGSYHVTQGFILNNQLTDFSPVGRDAEGRRMANRVEPGKRPRSSMAPTLVFHKAEDGSRGEFLLATGSPGGAAIIQYVVKTLVGMLDWGLDAQQAAALVDFGAMNRSTTWVGGEHPYVDLSEDGGNDALITGLRALGHTVSTHAQASGIATVMRREEDGAMILAGGADPRREGVALGDALH